MWLVSELGPGQLNNGLQLLACWLCACVCDFSACVCTCLCCLSSGIGFGVDPGPALPLHAVCNDRQQTQGRSLRSGGLYTPETHTSTGHPHLTYAHTLPQSHLLRMCMKNVAHSGLHMQHFPYINILDSLYTPPSPPALFITISPSSSTLWGYLPT